MSIFGFVRAKKAEHSITIMCRVLGVSRSGYHAWAGRPASARTVKDEQLTVRIKEIHAERHRRVYGSPRIWLDLLEEGEQIGRKRVERLMRSAGISGLQEKKWKGTTIRVPGVRVADDLLTATSPPRRRTRSGSPTSPTSERGKDGCISSPFRTCTPAGSSAGRWPTTCAPSS